MKFLDTHRTDILNCINQYGFTKSQFSFRKKKGRIIIDHLDLATWFSFYKQEDFFLDPDSLKKTDISHFEIKTSDSSIVRVNQWEDVITAINAWLGGLTG